ncbi:hypothetical protein BDW22DRAFT_1364507 [Trametopsis cervina]|nr:hypothetical protein BDW22DRAFT_1364507 [Trametopsis cervina]
MSGVVFEGADLRAESAADGGQTGSYGAMALTPEPLLHGTRTEPDLTHESALPASVHDGLLDIRPPAAGDSQQATDFTPPSDIFDTRDTADISGTRDAELTFDTAHSERGRGVERDEYADDDGTQVQGRGSVDARERIENEDDGGAEAM